MRETSLFLRDFGVGVVPSREGVFAHELLEHLFVFQVSAVQNGGVVSKVVVSDGRQRAEFQPLASRAATAQKLRAGVCGAKRKTAWSRRGRVDLYPHEGANRPELSCAALRGQHARGVRARYYRKAPLFFTKLSKKNGSLKEQRTNQQRVYTRI